MPHDAMTDEPVHSRARGRIAPIVRDVLLLVLGAGLAVAAEEWRDRRAHAERGVLVRASLVAELRSNARAVEWSRQHHLRMMDTLSAYQSRHELPPERIYFGGIVNPAAVSQTAWLSARESGALNELPYDKVLAIAGLYERQAGYRELADHLRNTLTVDIAHMGAEAAIRDRAFNFITVDMDFANREMVLLRGYREAAALLEGSPAARAPETRP